MQSLEIKSKLLKDVNDIEQKNISTTVSILD